LGGPYDGKPFRVGSITFFRTNLIALAVGAVLVTALLTLAWPVHRRGVAMRALAENREAAALMGIRRGRVTASAWWWPERWPASRCCSGHAGLLRRRPEPRDPRDRAVVAFPGRNRRGLDSTGGAIVGAVVVA